MSETSYADLPELAGHLRTVLADKAQRRPNKSPFVLLYAFNGTGKTRLSTAFKDLGKAVDENGEVQNRDTLYFNAFTEDLFSWDNDLENDEHRTLKLNTASSFFVGLNELEIETRIRPLLDRYADFDFKINFAFDGRTGKITSAEVTFSREVLSGEGDDARTDEVDGIKISRGEENIFIWCFFLAILQLALDGAEAYSWVEHVYIDDPISSLDEHNAIVVGNHLVQLYREAQRPIRTVVSTHHALFFNVLHYELKSHVGATVAAYPQARPPDMAATCLLSRPATRLNSTTSPRWQISGWWRRSVRPRRSTSTSCAPFWRRRRYSSATIIVSACIKEAADDADGILHQRFVDLLSHGKYSMYEPTPLCQHH